MDRGDRFFAVTMSGVHGVDHLLKRLFPPLVPIWAVAFGFPLWKLGLILGVRSFGSAVGQAPIGHLADRYDRRYILPAGIALIGIGIVAFAAVPLIPAFTFDLVLAGVTVEARFAFMLVAMFAAGVGSSAVHPAGYPLIIANIREDDHGKVLGMWGSAAKFGDGLAPAFVGVLLVVIGWSEIIVGFGLLAVIYAVILAILLGAFETRPAENGAHDATGSDDPEPTDPGVDRRVYLYPILAVFAYFVIQIAATAGVTAFLPQFITAEYGYAFSGAGISLTAESTASFYFSALLLIAGVAQLGTGALADRYDLRVILLVYLALGAGLLALFALVPLGPVALIAVLALLGVTLWGLNPIRDALISQITPPGREGRTFGYLWTGALLVASGAPAIVGYFGDMLGLRFAFAVLAGVILFSAAPIVLLLSDRVYVDASVPEAGTGAD